MAAVVAVRRLRGVAGGIERLRVRQLVAERVVGHRLGRAERVDDRHEVEVGVPGVHRGMVAKRVDPLGDRATLVAVRVGHPLDGAGDIGELLATGGPRAGGGSRGPREHRVVQLRPVGFRRRGDAARRAVVRRGEGRGSRGRARRGVGADRRQQVPALIGHPPAGAGWIGDRREVAGGVVCVGHRAGRRRELCHPAVGVTGQADHERRGGARVDRDRVDLMAAVVPERQSLPVGGAVAGHETVAQRPVAAVREAGDGAGARRLSIRRRSTAREARAYARVAEPGLARRLVGEARLLPVDPGDDRAGPRL